jgi:hypothetical protein
MSHDEGMGMRESMGVILRRDMYDLQNNHLAQKRRKAYTRDQVGDDKEDALKREWLKVPYTHCKNHTSKRLRVTPYCLNLLGVEQLLLSHLLQGKSESGVRCIFSSAGCPTTLSPLVSINHIGGVLEGV